MKERPILFSGPMVRAILEGRKTQTRRVIKPQPSEDVRFEELPNTDPVEGWQIPGHSGIWSDDDATGKRWIYSKPGDRLWVRETFSRMGCKVNCGRLGCHTIYRADEHAALGVYGAVKWKPSIYMPRWASRITLEITGVKVERVRDISEADAKSEGIKPPSDHYSRQFRNYYRDGFQILWDSLNSARGFGWDKNPWVWVITFKKL